MQLKVDHLEEKGTENKAKMLEQEGQISHLKTMIESIQLSGPSHDELLTDLRSSNDNKASSIRRKESSSGDSSSKAVVPSSCRELALIVHELDGLYLVQHQDTNKIETVYCDFGTSSKSLLCMENVNNLDMYTYIFRDNRSFTLL